MTTTRRARQIILTPTQAKVIRTATESDGAHRVQRQKGMQYRTFKRLWHLDLIEDREAGSQLTADGERVRQYLLKHPLATSVILLPDEES
ncbi:hypothetical protein [Streptomyces sp. NPDC093261]|uniref:hypothetical protein n=1 Tax=Streptomyces sp. NPDC093261 TaxID=3366037 RepID=UPI00380518D3